LRYQEALFLKNLHFLYWALMLVMASTARADTDAPAREWTGHTKLIRSLAFSPDGKLFASSSDDQTIIIRDVKTGAIKKIMPRLAQENDQLVNVAHDIAFFPDGSKLAAAYSDGRIVEWDIATAKVLQSVTDENSIYQIAVSPDGALIAADGGNGVLRIWDAKNLQKINEDNSAAIHFAFHMALEFSPDGTKLAAASFGGVVTLWDMKTDRRKELTGKNIKNHITALAFSPDGKTLVGGTYSSEIKFWNAATGELQRTLQTEEEGMEGIPGIGFVQGGKSLVVANGKHIGQLQLWDVESGEQTRILRNEINTVALAVSPDGKTIAVGFQDGKVLAFSL
jgi:WD40 repeat protein